MIIDIEAKSVHQIDIDHNEAFRILCKTLNMAFVLDEDVDYFVVKEYYGGANAFIARWTDTMNA